MFSTKALCWLLIALNLGLLAANLSLSRALSFTEHLARAEREAEWQKVLHGLRRETAHLLSERVRLVAKSRGAGAGFGGGRSADPGASAAEIEPTPESRPGNGPGLGTPSPSGSILDALETPLLAPGEMEALVSKRDAIGPVRPGEGLLRTGRAEDVLRSREWNPEQRELSVDEKVALEEWLEAYRYYSRGSLTEGLETEIKPAVADLTGRREFVEYPVDEPGGLPPALEEGGKTVLSATDVSDRPGYRRLFYFFPSEYPEMYHREEVQMERSLEAYVRIYELINAGRAGTPEPEEQVK